MIKKWPLFILVFLFQNLFFAQELYVPRDVKQAYKNETRSLNGMPGKNYWQNTATYNINVNVNPPDRRISGSEKITYTNNSPDTLNTLSFKLILNNHKAGAARLGQSDPDFLTEGISITNFTENGKENKWVDKNDGTNKTIKLLSPLFPNSKVVLSLDWNYEMSVQSGREGAIDSTTFFLAYFYPRVAVYDDYAGWDRMTFTGSQEFYNDFNDYHLEVTVPRNYIVWATGDLLNPSEVLQKNYADKLSKSMTSDEIISIANQDDLSAKKITKQEEKLTWKWEASNITDIAVAISDHYNWDASSVIVDEKTKRRASVQAAYDEKSEDFKEMVNYTRHSLNWFSNNYPGVPYPFSKSTVVRGFADMEYPMMVNDNSTGDADFTRFVVEHEIAHTYFPFYMGINETRYGFMDEGWATALEYLISTADLGKEKATQNFQQFRVNRWINDKSMEQDIPIITPSNILSGSALGNNEYGKAALGYLAVKDILGDEQFKSSLQEYMKRWNGKHPLPWDFFYSFNDSSGKDLNWFWNAWYFSHNYIDLAIEKVDVSNNSVNIKLKNLGGMPAPVDILVTDSKGNVKTIHQSPEIWKGGDTAMITLKDVSSFSNIEINGGIFMDADTSNNSWKMN